MKKLLIAATTLFALTASADWGTSAFTTSVSSEAEVAQVIAGINSGRIRVPGCNGQQKVYAYNYSNNKGSYVVKADGSFRPVGSKATFKVRCQD
jgi:hypothetical protein